MIEKDFDIPFVAQLASREKQIQQNYRPFIAIHKWFARRPGTLFRSLLLSEFGPPALRNTYFKSNVLHGLRIADPFMGGGTPLVEANRMGCDVIGYDINPMSYWIVRQELEFLDLLQYRKTARELTTWLEHQVGHFYRTRCLSCGLEDASVKYFLWVKTQLCKVCGTSVDLFPGLLLAEDRRHPQNVFVCPTCGDLTETPNRKTPGNCRNCGTNFASMDSAKRNRCPCPHCGATLRYPDATAGRPSHRMFAIEYHCARCKPLHRGRFFKKPDSEDLSRYADAKAAWSAMVPDFVPTDRIPSGDETDRLHRWGYQHYREMFNERQLLGLELSCRFISAQSDTKLSNALATNLSDLLRYQNMLCRYDTMALKSLDIFSIHGFPVSLVQCESNFLGIANGTEGVNIGSGGWTNIIEKYARARAYCDQPFEIRYDGSRKVQVSQKGEWIGEHRDNHSSQEHRHVELHCASSTVAEIPPGSLDAVITDPPYLGNVQYAELMDFCYVWLRRLVGGSDTAFASSSTRDADELTHNATMERGVDHFTAGLSVVFSRMARALKPGSPLVFTFHHNTFEAYYPLAISILDAGLVCSASLPCPAEMEASIHIGRSDSSIVDTVFVCRSTGRVPRRWIAQTPEEVALLIRDDVQSLRDGNVVPTRGDVRCIAFGHLARLAIWNLRLTWDPSKSTAEKLSEVARCISNMGVIAVLTCLDDVPERSASPRSRVLGEQSAICETDDDVISF